MHNVHIDHTKSIIKERMSKIKNKIIIMSNKGGVGKSTISTLIATALVKKGFKTGILDADIHGPSIAKMTGIENLEHEVDEKGIARPIVKENLKIVSMGSIIKETNKALIWRGPIKISVIRQFLSDFDWGELDYLIIDLPPGTGDEPLSICQEIDDIKGAVIVTTGQKISMLDAQKAIDFLNKINIKIISIVENMSEVICPHCNKSFKLFHSKEDIYEKLKDLKIIKIPYYTSVMEKLDNGRCFEVFENNNELLEKIESIIK
ncbi:MAG: Mrp/NBP35 family ATP-binding protein [Elusimicrobiota bacterium]